MAIDINTVRDAQYITGRVLLQVHHESCAPVRFVECDSRKVRSGPVDPVARIPNCTVESPVGGEVVSARIGLVEQEPVEERV